MQRIASLQAQLAAALAVVEKADLFRQAMENIWTEDGFTSGEAEVANAFDAAREALRVLRVLSGKE